MIFLERVHAPISALNRALTSVRASAMSRSALIYMIANVANAAVPFLLLPILTRVLSPLDYGLVAMFGLTLNALNAIVGLNAGSAVTVRYFRLPPERLRVYVGNTLFILFGSTLMVLVGVIAIGQQASAVTQLPLPYLGWAILASVCQFMTALRLTLWQVSGKAKRYGMFQVVQSIVNAVGSLVLVLLLHLSWQGRIFAQTATGAIFATLAIASLIRARAISFSFNADDLTDALRFGVPLIPHIGGALLIAAADRVLIAHMLSLADAGIYVVGAQIGLALSLLTDAFNRAYAPWMYSELAKGDPERDRAIVRGTYVYCGVVLLLALAIGAFAPIVVSFCVGPKFAAASSLVLFISLGYAFGGMYYMVTNYVFYTGKTGRLALVTLSAGVFNVCVTYLLIRQNGLVGAAQGFALSQLALFGGTWWLAQRSRPMPWLSPWAMKKTCGRVSGPEC